MNNDATSVTTTHGIRYTLGPVLGRGGQGTVYRIANERLAAKVLGDSSSKAQEKLADQLAMVQRLPLDDLPIARPLDRLRSPRTGYVMELVTGMVPLGKLVRPPTHEPDLVAWYIRTGGLRRRLRLLARFAEVFSRLHGKGIIYVDPSPNNLLVSEDPNHEEIRLIDADNLRIRTGSTTIIYTPGYGAPELVTGKELPSSLTDVYAFAVIAFEVLALHHPLIGDKVHDGEPEMEEMAYAGQFPWVGHPDDTTNASSNGFPLDLVLSKRLRTIFHETFGPGLTNPDKRPGMARWAEVLSGAANHIVVCSRCRATYYAGTPQCPVCKAASAPFVKIAALLWDPERYSRDKERLTNSDPGLLTDVNNRPTILTAATITQGETIVLDTRWTHGLSYGNPVVKLHYDAERVTVTRVDSAQHIRLVSTAGPQKEVMLENDPLPLKVSTNGVTWRLHFGEPNIRHRVLVFDISNKEQR